MIDRSGDRRERCLVRCAVRRSARRTPIRCWPWVLALFAVLLATGPKVGAQVPLSNGALGALAPWSELVRWADAIEFSRTSAERARSDLTQEGLNELDRAAALYTLGAGGLAGESQRLTQQATFGPPLERWASLMALGELPRVPAEFLAAQAIAGDPLVAGISTLAMMLGEGREDRPVLARAMERNPNLRARIEGYRDALAHPGLAQEEPVLAVYLGLRFEAAKRYGYFSGQRWSDLRAEELAKDPAFLEPLVLAEAAASGLPGVADFLLERLLAEPVPAVLEAALVAMPKQLDQLVENGIWVPKTRQQSLVLLEALEQRRPTPQNAQLLSFLMAQPELVDRAAALTIEVDPEGRVSGAFQVLEPLLKDIDPARRRLAALALGRSGSPTWVPELERIDFDADPKVRIAALVARLALGDRRADPPLVQLFVGGDEELQTQALRDLALFVRLPSCRSLLAAHFDRFDSRVGLECAIALAPGGDSGARVLLRQALQRREAGDLAPSAVTSLASSASPEDAALFARIFPSNGDLGLDLALARALIELDDPAGRRFLSAGLWDGNFSLGVLAACALAGSHGLPALYDELESPPAASHPRDLRRLGFAIGMIGGLSELDRLCTTRRNSDPSVQGAYLGALTNRTR